MHKIKIAFLIVGVAGVLWFVFTASLSLAEPRQAAAPILVQDADTTLALASTQSAGLQSKIDTVGTRFVLQFANQIRFLAMPAFPSQLTDKLDVVEPRFVLRFANKIRKITIPTLPTALDSHLGQVRDRIKLRFVNKTRKVALEYPNGWLEDSTGPVTNNIQVNLLSDTSASITWLTDEFANSQVNYGTQSNSYTTSVVEADSVKDHTVTLTNLTSGTKYYFRVTSTDLSGNQAQSNEISFTTADQPPSAPTGLALSGTPNTSATFTWNAHPDVASGWGYKLYYDTDSGQPPFTGSGLSEGASPIDVGTVTQYTLSGLNPQQTYYVSLRVYNQNGTESGYASPVTIPGQSPPSLQVSPNQLSFAATSGGSNPAAQTITLSANDGSNLNWTATSNASWLSLNTSAGTTPATVSVTVDITGLSESTYTGKVTITSPAAANSPREVAVTLNLSAPAPAYPNDTRFGEQWGLAKTEAQAAWNISKGASDVVIAVIDSGVDYAHPDLADKVNISADRDFVNNDADALDDNGHGTHVAGIAAAATNNNQGIAGVCPNCSVLPLKALAANGSGDLDDAAEAIRYATDQGASVINMSFGGESCWPALAEAINYAYDNDVTLVAAAGNACPVEVALGLEDFAVFYPAIFERVIAVGATTPNDERADFSSYGPELDIAAPGTEMLSTYLGNSYESLDGTSMAAPMVAGAAGLVVSQNSALSPAQVQNILERAADDLGPVGRDDFTGWGRLNIQRALQLTANTVTDAPVAVCPATVQKPPQSREDELVILYRQLRDTVFNESEIGQQYVGDFYQHAPEMAGILFTDATLRSRVAQFLENASDDFGSLMTDETVILSQAQYDEANGLINDLADASSPHLAKTIRDAWAALNSDIEVGKSADQIWADINEPAIKTLYLPFIVK